MIPGNLGVVIYVCAINGSGNGSLPSIKNYLILGILLEKHIHQMFHMVNIRIT